ncbi:MAG: hypothetical protein ACLFSR_10495 [Halomonas sp.]
MPLFVIEPVETDDDTRAPEPDDAQSLGYAAGVRWYKADTIPDDGREPTTEELSAALLELPAIRQLKAAARRKIEREVGDLHEILADQAKQIEALTALTSRLAADYLGGTAMHDETKAAYLERVESIVGALDSGDLTLRGDMEGGGASEMVMKVLGRANRINEIIAQEYLPRRSALLD